MARGEHLVIRVVSHAPDRAAPLENASLPAAVFHVHLEDVPLGQSSGQYRAVEVKAEREDVFGLAVERVPEQCALLRVP